eukprot:814391-Prorocentrum_minimum.AAC.1
MAVAKEQGAKVAHLKQFIARSALSPMCRHCQSHVDTFCNNDDDNDDNVIAMPFKFGQGHKKMAKQAQSRQKMLARLQ